MLLKPGYPILIDGESYMPGQLKYFDEAGYELKFITWIDTDAQTFGQLVVDEMGKAQVDPADQNHVWEIVRYGAVRMEVRE